MAPDVQDLYDIYGLIYVPLWRRSWVIITLYVLLTIAAMSLLIGAYLWYQRYKARKKKLLWQVALHDLAHNRFTMFIEKNQSNYFYADVIAVLKSYLAQRYQVPLLSMTDDEMIAFFEVHNFSQEVCISMRDIVLGGCEAKFANVRKTQDAMKYHLASAIALVKHTIPIQPPSS